MNLSYLSDQELMSKTKELVKEESTLLVKILHHIKEIDRRRLYSDYKQPGLLELVMNELGYSRDQALRRIQAMRMMRDNPIVEEKIEAGELNLTTIGIVQTLFSSEKREGKPLSLERKLEVIEKVSGKSTREAQKIVFSMSSTPIKLNEKIKMIGPNTFEFTAAVDEKTVQLLEQLKGMLAHTHPNISNGDLIKRLAEIGVNELDRTLDHSKKRGGARQRNRADSVVSPRPASTSESKPQIVKIQDQDSTTRIHDSKIGVQDSKARIYDSKNRIQASETRIQDAESRIQGAESKLARISKAEIKRQLWQRDRNQCTQCQSTFALQEDHRWPKAKGGDYTLNNMRLLCRSCNQRAAIKHFGVRKMEKFLISTN